MSTHIPKGVKVLCQLAERDAVRTARCQMTLSELKPRSAVCARCQNVVSDDAAKWDGLAYCRTCIELAGLSHLDPELTPLEETLNLPLKDAVRLGVVSGIGWTLITVGMVWLMLVLFAVAHSVALQMQPPANPPKFLDRILAVSGMAVVLLGLVIFPTSVQTAIAERHRRISVKDGVLIVQSGNHITRMVLFRCSWTLTAPCLERHLIISIRRPLVTVYSSPVQRAFFGFDDESARMWIGFLRLCRVRELVSPKWVDKMPSALMRIPMAGIIGVGLGGAMHFLTANNVWITVGIILGILDGLASSIVSVAAPERRESQIAELRNSKIIAVSCAVVALSAMGFEIGWMFGGLNMAVTCMAANGIAGLWIVRNIFLLTAMSEKPQSLDASDETKVS